jgi:hypothetical protein
LAESQTRKRGEKCIKTSQACHRLAGAELASNNAAAKDKKLSMAASVSRKLKNAAAATDNVGRGVFAKAG